MKPQSQAAHPQTTQDTPCSTDAKTAPLSFAQERLWYLDQLQQGLATYNRPANIRITGPLNVTVLERSLHDLVCRHESLRMRFLDRGPSVEVAPLDVTPLELIDLSGRNNPSLSVDEMTRHEASQPFDLQACPPIRLKLLRLNASEHLLFCTLHHIVFDGWSQTIFLRELGQLYRARSLEQSPVLPKLDVQYTDVVIQQRQRLEQGQLEQHIDYWRQQLSGSRSALGIPTDYIRPVNASELGARHTFRLPETLTEQLRDLNNTHRVTMFMTLLAAFQTLLYRYTGQTNITTGAPIAGRTHQDMEGLIGLFINTLPLRVDLSENPRFDELIKRVRRSALEAYQHQEVPLQTIVEEAATGRSATSPPLFDTLFNLQPAIEPVHAEEVTFCCAGVKTDTAKADLSIDLKYSTDDVYGEFEYRSELFAPSTVENMASHWIRILEQVADNPEIRLDDLSLIDDADRHQLVVEWNQTAQDYPSDVGVHELIEKQAACHPDKTAVVMDECRLSYAELDRQANQLANHLKQATDHGTKCVVLLAERSVEMIIGILGILKSGACYIPVDATTPAERIRFILSETQATLLTTHQELTCDLNDIASRHVCLDRDSNRIQQAPVDRPEGRAGGSELAYIIYTSGSTGEPKGVMVEHHSVVNYARTVGDVLGVTAEDRVLQFASIGFDASVEEIFGALTNGATLVLRDQDSISSVPKFLNRISQWKITFASLPTAFWHELAHQMRADSLTLPPCLTTVVIGGQKASSRAVEAWQEIAGDHVNLFNTYGPTETTVVTTIAQWTGSQADLRREFPIGRPVPNSSVFVLDTNQHPVPIGVAGELYVAGRGVARGYFNRPELTDEYFTPCPFTSEPQGRMYRTGDRVRWLGDGQIEFLDRVDNQVKVRGFRVEPQEISSCLESLSTIRQSVVIAQEEESDQTQLVAYIFPSGSSPPSSRELRTSLAKLLPDFMIPSAFVFLDSLPLTNNGKVDEEALSSAESAADEPLSKQPPQTEVQRQLASIWQEILGIPDIGLHDQFFELGGHSLKAMQMVARLTDRFSVDISLRQIFQKSTLAELAEEIEQRQRAAQNQTARKKLPSITAISRERRRKTA